ncbi:hypothetical protein V8B55DRAFT_1504631 [Mucor lusitanicus]|uniref:Uncharacterized protein n=2 Tax=Mucor circinelloides f. lusitanicus TaxID=29924 RepID=A0A168Q7F4_MUCCL|nr:hypothetical protein FB192DRAFT_1367676 [Mucor lusitanicus]OAD08814.1 hypothetical protein MUCCIDRAFT_158994 [Mucor lusitanicus CBS 277.49]
MSVIKTKCPNLSDLSKVLGPIDGVSSQKPAKPLCENIFDVQRSELFEVLESLRHSFWNDNIATEPAPTPFQQPQFAAPVEESPMSPSKRVRESDDDDDYNDEYSNMSESESRPSIVSKKRARLTTPQAVETPPLRKQKPTQTNQRAPPSTSSLKAYKSLWQAKQTLIREIKSVNCRDSDVVAALMQFYQTKPSDQCRHMSVYLLPAAEAMRRKGIVDALQKWV